MIIHIHGHQYDVVTSDPDQLELLHGAGLDSVDLAMYASEELGLRPQHWPRDTDVPPIAWLYPNDRPPAIPIWDTWNPDDEPGEEDGEPDDGPDPWAALDD